MNKLDYTNIKRTTIFIKENEEILIVPKNNSKAKKYIRYNNNELKLYKKATPPILLNTTKNNLK